MSGSANAGRGEGSQRQKAEYDGKSDESGGISNPEHAHRVTKWVIISVPEVVNPIDVMTIASPVTLHMKHAQRKHVSESMVLVVFSKFLYEVIVVFFHFFVDIFSITCNMQCITNEII